MIAVRLMGKRTIGELQPFEFVIALAAADLACTPMQDISVPILYGIVPILMLFIIHYFTTLLTTKSVFFRKFVNGKPVIVINEDGIDMQALKKLNMNVNDILESIRGSKYFSLEQISFGIVETNGKLSILPNETAEAPQSIPLSLIVDGKYIDENLKISDQNQEFVDNFLKNKKLKPKEVALLTTESGKFFVQPINAKYFTEMIA
jgi:uncharacterized membrane protein YcaP (DUF421 family)